MNTAQRKYTRRFTFTMFCYVAVLFAVVWVFVHHPPHGPLAYVLAALPALPVLGTIVAMGIYMAEEEDEFLRALQSQAMLWGIGVTLAVTTVWGFVENFTSAPHLQGYLVFPIFCVVWGTSRCLIERRYR